MVRDGLLLKITNEISSRISRKNYEELLVELDIYSLSSLLDDEDIQRLNKKELILNTLRKSNHQYDILYGYHNKYTFSKEIFEELLSSGINLSELEGSGEIEEKVELPTNKKFFPNEEEEKGSEIKKIKKNDKIIGNLKKVKSFLNENWKWIITTFIAILGVVAVIYAAKYSTDVPIHKTQTAEHKATGLKLTETAEYLAMSKLVIQTNQASTAIFNQPSPIIKNETLTNSQPTAVLSPSVLTTPIIENERNEFLATGQNQFTNEMIRVPAGDFTMGLSYSNSSEYDFSPEHNVFVDEFFIDKYEVTNTQYFYCVEAGNCTPPLVNDSNTRVHYFDDLENFGNYPVIFVTWEQAKIYCEWRNTRLPTEAEWEKTAKWDPTKKSLNLYPWGKDEPIYLYANFNDNDTSIVGKFENGKSFFGVYDMAGNVLEWVSDYYDGNYYKNSQIRNPKGPEHSYFGRVVRGGAWSSVEKARLWTVYRDYYQPTISRSDLGFRCASDKAP
jgi:formylglycine-generating enzyme required for sulfatase activity